MLKAKNPEFKPLYRTTKGVLYLGDSEQILDSKYFGALKGRINLIFTSPPFPLNKKKAYGNLKGNEYIEWLSNFGPIFREMLAEDGSLVIELGNAWIPGSPTMSLLSLEALVELKRSGGFHLCQEFIWNNTSRLPTPAQWVNVERIRVKDSFTKLWWMAKSERPKADNRRVLKGYGKDMQKLMARGSYNFGKRPSEHRISANGFFKDNKGAIPSNVLSIANTASRDPYLTHCKQNGIKYHPARMPKELAKFFVLFLTEPEDLVLDPFAGSNVTGCVAEENERRWRSIEMDAAYAASSKARFIGAWDL